MKLWKVAALIALAAIPLLAAEKKSGEPFYRRFLAPGNPLDDRILEQEKRVAADPESAGLRNDFGNLLAQRRFPKEAREQYEKAMKLDLSNYLAPYNLGMLFETIGETSRAIAAYEKSVDRNRGFPPSRFRLGRLYEKRGWKNRAIRQYARAFQIDPQMRDPRYNPLVVDSALMDQVSLLNYPRDMARASLGDQAAWAEPERFRHVPTTRPLSSADIMDQAAPEPINVARPGTTMAPAPLPPKAREIRPQAIGGPAVAPSPGAAPREIPPRPVWNPTPPAPAPTRVYPPGMPVFSTPLPQATPSPEEER
jgi:tetratricopeptide (TPR) repeat protein